MRAAQERRSVRRGSKGAAGRVPAALLAALALLGTLAGCTPVEPWVKPYEREHLAEPIMALSRNSIAASYRDHMFETREGSHGATGAVGGGCGCN
ncbi:MAG TPA: DUF4266 domain-containing protein [Steroidobacteraceae bacterium]|nr:DUF4266 domain-containing protein [Steroidobacteraceae bacterium]